MNRDLKFIFKLVGIAIVSLLLSIFIVTISVDASDEILLKFASILWPFIHTIFVMICLEIEIKRRINE